jgi:4-hydroxy 2-oxovalerate aldolase
VEPILDLVGSDMLALKDQEPTWGYNTSYLITGLANAHPRDAIAASKKHDVDFVEQYKSQFYK